MAASDRVGEHYLDIHEKGQTYHPELVAEEVMWPLVDEMWRGDWRSEAAAGMEFVLPKVDYYEDRKLDVLLVAEHGSFFDDDEEEDHNLHTVTLTVEEPIGEEHRDLMFGLIKGAVYENMRSADDSEDDDYRYKALLEALPETIDGIDVELNKGWSLDFDSDGNYMLETYRSIGAPGDCMIPHHSAEDAVGISPHIRKHDLDALAEACIVLGASDRILEGLRAVRQHPIDMH